MKLIDTLVKLIATDEADNKQASAVSAAAFSQMKMQIQHMSFAVQQQMQEMQKFFKRAERLEKKKAKKKRIK
jgi:hypothetical protein